MNQEQSLLLETVCALNSWLDVRIAQDTELKTILTNIITSVKRDVNDNKHDNLATNLSVDVEESIAIAQASPEKLAELQSKWTSPTITTYPSAINKDISTIYQNSSPLDSRRVDHIRRCLAIKAEAFCLQIDRLEEPDAPTETAQGQLIARANIIGTRLWIFDVAPTLCPYPEQLADLSALFLVCADSSALLVGLLNDLENDQESAFKEQLTECLNLIAEAQSMLKTALERVTFAYEDPDQKQLFSVVRDLTSQKQIYIPRYMKTKDQADPSLWRHLKARLQDFARRLEVRRSHRHIGLAQQQIIKKAKGQISYHLGRIRDDVGIDHDWKKIADALIQWSESGLKADDLRLRDMLEPVTMLLPETLHNESQKLIYAYLQSWDFEDEEEAEEIADTDAQVLDDPEIQRVANWLRGRTVVLIGGNERPLAKAALIEAFALRDVIWIATRPHETLEILKTPIRRDEVRLVMLVIRWASHAYGKINAFCHQLDKPFIRLPAGYNPRRVAHEIISQASHAFDLDSN